MRSKVKNTLEVAKYFSLFNNINIFDPSCRLHVFMCGWMLDSLFRFKTDSLKTNADGEMELSPTRCEAGATGRLGPKAFTEQLCSHTMICPKRKINSQFRVCYSYSLGAHKGVCLRIWDKLCSVWLS